MNPLTCSRLDDVRNALTQGHWPQACAAELRAHVDVCARCAQEVLLTTHFQQARVATIAAAQPTAPSLVWWRAQVRRRNSALERASRPIAAAQIFALAIAVATLVGIVAAHWHSIADQTAPTWSLTTVLDNWGLVPLIVAITLITTLGGVVVYLSTDRQ
jgi:anti-sigma factor RsiW